MPLVPGATPGGGQGEGGRRGQHALTGPDERGMLTVFYLKNIILKNTIIKTVREI